MVVFGKCLSGLMVFTICLSKLVTVNSTRFLFSYSKVLCVRSFQPCLCEVFILCLGILKTDGFLVYYLWVFSNIYYLVFSFRIFAVCSSTQIICTVINGAPSNFFSISTWCFLLIILISDGAILRVSPNCITNCLSFLGI